MRTSRVLAVTGVLTVAVGLAAAPNAVAATGPAFSNPRVTPAPVLAPGGTATEDCAPNGTPGWVGLSTALPTLSADVQLPAGATVLPDIAVTDTTVVPHTSVLRATELPVQNGTVSVQVPNLRDGHSYVWHAYTAGAGVDASTPECHFRLDLTAPAVNVNSTDFPALGSGQTATKYAGQSGTFTFTGSDPVPAGGAASGVACYQYALAPASLGVFTGCGGADTVVPAADGTASVQLTPADWGANTLLVQAIDNAGNVSQSFSYGFYAPSNPTPPATLGDVDNNGTPDIVLPDSAGNLQVISGNTGSVLPSETVPAVDAPDGSGNWTGFEVSHRGWMPNTATSDTVFARDLNSSVGKANLYEYKNQGSLPLGSQSATLVSRPTTCQDATGATISCPVGYGSDWSGVDQLLALGSTDPGQPDDPSLLTVEGGNLWLFDNVGFRGFRDAQQLTTTGNWSGYDLIAPGADAQGNLALWARDRATGELHAYPLPKKADGTFDFSALGDPTAHVVASGFTTAAYPTLGSSGDLDGDGAPDLWTVTADRHLVIFSGWTSPEDIGALK
ncbi:hypothetical protein OG455_24225 [Kitasatospora sp. NBC_01287]|uniref:hypothetical protein n=1 Tax=Kitasatospora sp. NBC_01287 TaxID=2903573 RepID=UPI00225A2E98|nr:hypothetical protein [Kitasatospora sp. NBC_01287]MCX4748586.1 hypothetical protein [Kitasatospora sp. NBC_01287]